MDYGKYLANLEEKYGKNDDKSEWNRLRSQINSGYYLGLSEEDLNRYAILTLTYEQRELIKFICYMKMSKEFIDKMAERVVNHNMPPGEMLDAIKEKILSDGNNVDLAKEFSNIKEKLDNQMKEILKSNDEQTKIHNLEEELKHKNQEIAAFKKKISDLEAANKDLSKEIKVLKEENRPSDDNFKDQEDSCLEEKLPQNFSLSAYLLNSDLSSSQMEIIATAVKLGINTRLIKQMVDSNKEPEKLKQIVEVLLAQMEKEKHTVNDIGDIDMELFNAHTN